MIIWYLSAYDRPNGQSSRSFEYAKELVLLGNKVTFFTNGYCHFFKKEILSSNERSRSDNINGVNVIWLKTFKYHTNGLDRAINMFSNVYRILTVHKKISQKPDLIIGPSVPILSGWVASYLSLKYKCPFIYEVRDVWPQALVDNGSIMKYGFTYIFFRFIERLIYRRASLIVSALPEVESHIRLSGYKKNKKIIYLPNGTSIPVNKNLYPIIKKEESFICMYIGGYSVAHDLDSIIDAAYIIRNEDNKKIKFIIVGDGIKKNHIEKRIKELDLNNVVLLPRIDKSQVLNMLLTADVLIATVTNSPIYKFGINLNKIYDYLASSKPIIFSGPIKCHFIESVGCGFSIPPENPLALAEAINKIYVLDGDARARMGDNGFSYLNTNFNIKSLAVVLHKQLLGLI